MIGLEWFQHQKGVMQSSALNISGQYETTWADLGSAQW